MFFLPNVTFKFHKNEKSLQPTIQYITKERYLTVQLERYLAVQVERYLTGQVERYLTG